MQNHKNQSGMLPFKSIVIIFGVGFVLLIVIIIATAGPARRGAESQPADKADSQTAEKKEATKAKAGAAVKIPEGFRRFTSKQYGFSVAYPEAWGNLLTGPTAANAILRAETNPVVYPLNDAQMTGNFSVSVYPAVTFRIATRLGNPFLAPIKKDTATSWQVTSVDPYETKLNVGDKYKIASSVNPSGLTIHDFSWLNDGKRQARWVFESGNNYIIMLLPSLSRADGTEPTSNDLLRYADFAESVITTANVPKK